MGKNQRDAQQLLKLLIYILGRRPDEFGLVPDEDGYVKIKDLIKAIGEEEGLRHIRQKNIDMLFITLQDPPLERDAHLIRARLRDKLPSHKLVTTPPRLLYTCVRKRAYPVVFKNGISGMGVPRVILSTNRALAERIGRRYDHQAVLLTVNTQQCQAKGIDFYGFGDDILWATQIPEGCFTGPPLPEEKTDTKKTDLQRKTRPTPGSVILDPMALIEKSGRKAPPAKGRESFRKKGLKKVKRKRQPPPWRS